MTIPRAALGPLLLLFLLTLVALGRPAASEAAGISARTCTGANATVPGGFASAGQWAVLENNVGQRPQYGTSTNFTGVPLCAVRSTGTGTSGDPQWIFCTQASLYACGQDAFGGASLAADLDARARAEMAWAITTADLSTAIGRAVVQTRVWCVADRVQRHRADADIVADARAYFTDHGVTLPAGTACPSWGAVDAGLRPHPQLTARATSATVAAGDPARFEITTNLPEIRVAAKTADGVAASLDLCPDAPAGMTLSGGTLQLTGTSDAAARTVPLCAAGPDADGSTRLDVSTTTAVAGDLTVIRSLRSPSTCQLMVTARGGRLAASATVGTEQEEQESEETEETEETEAPVVATARSTPAPNLTIAKRRVRRHGEARRVHSGAAVRWAITVRNTGTGAASNVRVCDTLRRGLAVVHTTPHAPLSGGRACWRLKSVAAGGRVTLRITTRVSVGSDGARCHALANKASIVGGPSASSTVTVCHRTRTRSGGTTG
ncbi:hypothetical protein DSM104299_00532 [Baekduia alba]|uniref:hypothetical protein n=1 Tax=Baekduia alba TaxID=2997333 RepID=UPI002340FBD5|nr:hypothetical protein [Baekduia alba]WCB91854.1 hypothetical protein DSM104299_00532 [Baekduia alba]